MASIRTESDMEKFKGKFKGKIVLVVRAARIRHAC